MADEWYPSSWGRLLTRSPHWWLRLDGIQAELGVDGERVPFQLVHDRQLQVVRGPAWSSLHVHFDHGRSLALGGLPAAQGRHLQDVLHDLRLPPMPLPDALPFEQLHAQLRQWLRDAAGLLESGGAERRWITTQQQAQLLAQRQALLDHAPALEALFAHFGDDDAQQDLHDWNLDWPSEWAQGNQQMAAEERALAADFFARVERRPLTDEQVQAVVCFDNRVQLVAAAGSGKTSTLVAKAAYAIQRSFVTPAQVLMLAFNKDAANELQARSTQAFERLGMEGVQVQARTFHALGLQIISEASGHRPHVPGWAIDAAAGIERLAELVDDLKDRSVAFRTQWDMFRLVFGRDLPPLESPLPAEGHDRDGQPWVGTLQGERMRCTEQRVIADWLFYNGVDYQYRAAVQLRTADDTVHAEAAEFHYPQAGLRHQHRARGETIARTQGGVLQTTSAQLRDGQALQLLADRLDEHGIALDPNPDRELPAQAAAPMPDEELVGLMRSFIAHAKSNAMDLDAMAARLRQLPEDRFKERYRRFLQLAAPVMQAWDDALHACGGIDFEDMLNRAADLIEQGHYRSPYQLVMADEFQDASRARARLCDALAAPPGRHLFVVGDDWQSINRFAGADLSVMAGFFDEGRTGQRLHLQQTFRCPQTLCDVSSRFISRNPAQLPKQVHSLAAEHVPALQAVQADNREQLGAVIAAHLADLHRQLLAGQRRARDGGRLQVFVLGRYNSDRSLLPGDWQARFGQSMQVQFLTIHRSKGCEADHVIIPALVDRRFPNLRADDPVLGLAMPEGDTFPLAEERRLFYVALTRARQSVALFTVQGRHSPFLDELVRDGAVRVTRGDGKPVVEQRCPACGTGVLVQRQSQYGPFVGCSSYPRCEYKPRTPAVRG